MRRSLQIAQDLAGCRTDEMQRSARRALHCFVAVLIAQVRLIRNKVLNHFAGCRASKKYRLHLINNDAPSLSFLEKTQKGRGSDHWRAAKRR